MNEQQNLENRLISDSNEMKTNSSDNELDNSETTTTEATSHNITQINEGKVSGQQSAGDNSNQLQNVINVYPSEQNEEIFIDPTTPYYKDSQLFGFNFDDLPRYSKTLQEENIILVSCFHPSILKAAADALVESVNNFVDKRYLNLDQKSSIEIDFLKDQELGNKEGSLVVVNAVKTTQFLDWFTTYNNVLDRASFKEELKAKNRFLICLIDLEMLEKALQSKMQDSLHFCHWQVPFFSNLIKETFPMHATEIEKKITQQREKGLWGRSDKEFYELVNGFTKNGHLFKELEKREADNAREILYEERTGESSLFKDGEDLENMVLYVAVFFPELSPSSFYEVVSSLIAKDTTFITFTEVITEGEESKIVEKKQERLLIDIWKKDSDKILKKCHLKAVKSREKSRVIDFDSPYLRIDLREYIEAEYSTFFRSNFERVQDIGLLFYSSQRVTENVIRLYADVIESYSEDYAEDWLCQVILRSAKNFELEDDLGASSQKEIFGQLLELDTLKDGLIIDRISSLIREILNYSQLQNVVKNFLDKLILWKYDEHLLKIVKRLRFAPQFDQFYWIKQLLEQGKEKEGANEFLDKQLMQSGYRIYELLEKLKTWLPEINTENYSDSRKSVLQVFFRYCLKTKERFPEKNYGKWPPRLPLLAVLSKSSSSTNLETLFYWLFYPGLEKVSSNCSLTKRGELISEWWIIIHGLEKVDVSPDVADAMNTFLSAVITATTSNQQEKLLAFWENRKQELLEEMTSRVDDTKKPKLSKFPEKVQQDIKILNHKRQILNKLTKEFSALKG